MAMPYDIGTTAAWHYLNDAVFVIDIQATSKSSIQRDLAFAASAAIAAIEESAEMDACRDGLECPTTPPT